MKKIARFVYFVAAAFWLASAPCHAQTGTVDLVVSAVADTHIVQMGDTAVTARGGSGIVTVVRSSGRPFIEGAKATLQYAGFSKKTPSGLELEADGVATFTPEDTLLLLFERAAADLLPQDEGTLQLAGGSGRFAGVTGRCQYKMDDLPGEWNVTISKCQWQYSFPYR